MKAEDIDRLEAQVRQFVGLQDGVKGLAAEMKEQGIHIGMGKPGRCVTCGELWPCPGSGGESMRTESDE